MANTLPGTPYVESSDLVANYPAVSESLAERVDLVGVLPFASAAARTTALPTPTDGQYSYLQDTNSTEYYNGAAWVAAGISPGLVLVNSTSFTSVATVSLNDIFTSSYENYKIIIGETGTSTDQVFRARMRLSGTDNTAANYDTKRVYALGGTSVLGIELDNETGFHLGYSQNHYNYHTIEIFRPALATFTHLLNFNNFSNASYLEIEAGIHDVATAYDGLTIFSTTGNITGTIRVYGYAN